MYLLYVGESYNLEKDKNVEFSGYRIEKLPYNKGIKVTKYYKDKDNPSKFYKVEEFRFEEEIFKTYKRIYLLTEEEYNREVKKYKKELNRWIHNYHL